MFSVSNYHHILTQDPITKESVDSTLNNVLPNMYFSPHVAILSSKYSIKIILSSPPPQGSPSKKLTHFTSPGCYWKAVLSSV